VEQVKTHANYIKRLKETANRSFRLYEIATIKPAKGEMNEGRKRLFKMFASTHDAIIKKSGKKMTHA